MAYCTVTGIYNTRKSPNYISKCRAKKPKKSPTRYFNLNQSVKMQNVVFKKSSIFLHWNGLIHRIPQTCNLHCTPLFIAHKAEKQQFKKYFLKLEEAHRVVRDRQLHSAIHDTHSQLSELNFWRLREVFIHNLGRERRAEAELNKVCMLTRQNWPMDPNILSMSYMYSAPHPLVKCGLAVCSSLLTVAPLASTLPVKYVTLLPRVWNWPKAAFRLLFPVITVLI